MTGSIQMLSRAQRSSAEVPQWMRRVFDNHPEINTVAFTVESKRVGHWQPQGTNIKISIYGSQEPDDELCSRFRHVFGARNTEIEKELGVPRIVYRQIPQADPSQGGETIQ